MFGVYRQTMAFDYSFSPDGRPFFWGYHYEIIKGLAKNLNFTFFLNPLENNSFFYNDQNDLMVLLGCSDGAQARLMSFFVTKRYMYQHNYLAIPPGQEYNSYDKLFLPFDNTVWVLIIFTFVIAFSTIFVVINFMTQKQRKFVSGKNVSTPSLNVTAIFFGISQIILPRRNFARFLMMLFTIYCLIIRTAWQRKMFEFLQKDMRRPTIQSFEDFAQRNISFYMSDYYRWYFDKTHFIEG